MKYITIHCADTPNEKEFHATDIDSWHVERGFKRTAPIKDAFNPHLKAIGYHFVILVDGTIETGRAIGEDGAHVQGHNHDNTGICLIGKDRFTEAQWLSLYKLLTQLPGTLGEATVKGHYEWDTANGKTCPNFDVSEYVKGYSVPQEHVL